MKFRWIVLVAALLSAPNLLGESMQKGRARVEKIETTRRQDVRLYGAFATADTCIVRHDAGEYWSIGGWVVGNELYKNFLNPSLSCPSPYPYSVQEINFVMQFAQAVTFNASVDVELADMTDPTCPVPGDLLGISSTYSVPIPGPGLYDIWIPLDSPVVVNGPFFAGFFIGDALPAAAEASVVTDTIPVECMAWNIWDTAIGFVSLDTTVGFPGRLVLYASGTPGGTGGVQPPPAISFRKPINNDTLYGNSELWVDDTSGSTIIEFVKFEYWNGSSYIEIGRDYSGLSPLRNGVNPSGVGDGWGVTWSFTGRPEAFQKIRATAEDTLGRTSSDSVTVFLEPTPPVPAITLPKSGDIACAPVGIAFSATDENLSTIEMYRRDASASFYNTMTPLSQFSVGDSDGDPNDNNLVSNGEFGDYYNAPVAAAVAVRLWNNRGYTALMTESGSPISVQTLAERLAERFKTRANRGTYDEDVLKGLREYVASKGVASFVTCKRNPNYFDLRIAVEEEDRAVMIALSGTPGIWLAVAGFAGWIQSDSSYFVKVSDPVGGSLQDMPVRNTVTGSEFYYNGTWRNIDLMIALLPKNWTVTRSFIGADFNGMDGWSFSWSPSGITNGQHLYLRAKGTDATNMTGISTVLVNYDCSQVWVDGDYNGDGMASISDLSYLITHLIQKGPAPVGSPARADANCDNRANIADIVYYMNYLFGSTMPPCR